MKQILLALLCALAGAVSAAFTITPTLPTGYAQCAVEGGVCMIAAPTNIIFGAPGGYTAPMTVSSNINCNGVTFGGDPNPKIVKACFTSELGMDQSPSAPGSGGAPAPISANPTPPATGSNTVPQGYVQCALENGVCGPITGPSTVIYGAQGSYTAPLVATSSVPCNSVQFKLDPAPHFVKACFVAPIAPPPTPPTCPAILNWGWYAPNLETVTPAEGAVYSTYLPQPPQCIDTAQTRTWINSISGNNHVQGWCQTASGIETWTRMGPGLQSTTWPAPPAAAASAP